MIHYQITPVNPNAHLFEVMVTISHPDPDGQIVYLPNWIPGSYMIRDFAKHIQWIKAESQGNPIRLSKRDKSSWQLDPVESEVKLRYQVYAWDLSVRGAHLDQTHGFFNGSSVFLAVKGSEQQLCQVDIIKPQGDAFDKWRVATGLQPAMGTKEFEFGCYQAKDYDELIDCPVEMADFTLISFSAGDIPHHMVLVGQHQCDTERLKQDLIKICEYQINFFGKPAPMDRYVFMTLVLGNGFGGLEHRNSTALHCSRHDLPLKTDDPHVVKSDYQTFLDLCSHEYFHTWNVKRIKPAKFLPYDTQNESYTELLWVFEGFTAYYDSLMLVRAGVITQQQYLKHLAKTLTSVRRSKGRLVQTVTESSFDAWTKFYKQDENAPNSIVSYYTKGSLVALCLDLLIRKETQGEQSLDDVMQVLWHQFGQKNIGVEDQTVQQIITDICGEKLDDFFDRALYSTEELPVEQLLSDVGLELTYAARRTRTDRGTFTDETQKHPHHVDLGIEWQADETGIKVKNVYLDSAASKAGISAGDLLIAFNGLKISNSDFAERVVEFEVGDSVTLYGFRRDELMRFEVKLQAAERDTAFITYSQQEKNIYPPMVSWLGQD